MGSTAAGAGNGRPAPRAVPPTATPAAWTRKRRREDDGVFADVFVGGVLCTLSARVIGCASFVARVRAGAEVRTFPSACNYGTTIFMKKSIKVAPKKRRGRPPSGGRDPHVTIRMPTTLIEEADAWAAANGTVRSEAIRRLVELGHKAKR